MLLQENLSFFMCSDEIISVQSAKAAICCAYVTNELAIFSWQELIELRLVGLDEGLF